MNKKYCRIKLAIINMSLLCLVITHVFSQNSNNQNQPFSDKTSNDLKLSAAVALPEMTQNNPLLKVQHPAHLPIPGFDSGKIEFRSPTPTTKQTLQKSNKQMPDVRKSFMPGKIGIGRNRAKPERIKAKEIYPKKSRNLPLTETHKNKKRSNRLKNLHPEVKKETEQAAPAPPSVKSRSFLPDPHAGITGGCSSCH